MRRIRSCATVGAARTGGYDRVAAAQRTQGRRSRPNVLAISEAQLDPGFGADADAPLALVAFDRATLPWYAGQVLRAGEHHGGVVLFRRLVRTTYYGDQARLLTDFWLQSAAWDWQDRVVYLPRSPAIESNVEARFS